ncbi:HNH endonuclease [Herbidospora galbida]|uniref:HNH endonuclease n=1 Tax=Herbidospora galbida TaxID=2575442 RepID=A0A4U3M4X1_9ACTN|nr:HNH endonuclease [Herbidospora galbida]TKK83888.1 HNH endonuclease [Herbidospora galbida]
MIRIHRVQLPGSLVEDLARRTGELSTGIAGTDRARTAWQNAKSTRRRLTGHLMEMATGISRCMYCGDSLGTAIDHFEPLHETPLRVFDWLNHLLACTHCNSHGKRDRFPRDDIGAPLLIDPSSADPADHLWLSLTGGAYEALTPQGEATIEVFGLNRADLVKGRRAAFIRTKCMLRDLGRCAGAEADEIRSSLSAQPFADVLAAMIIASGLKNPPAFLGGPEVVAVLRTYEDGS